MLWHNSSSLIFFFDVKAIQDICSDYGLSLVEDCAQAHGGEYREGQNARAGK